MVNQFRQVVSAYINQNSEEKNWEEIRELFTVYSYVAFLLVAIKNTTGKVDRVKERAISLGLESKDNLNLLFSYPATENIAEEIARIIDDETQIDINAVYRLIIVCVIILLNFQEERIVEIRWALIIHRKNLLMKLLKKL